MANHQLALDQMFLALGDPTRRAIVDRLAAGSASVKELAAPFRMALPSFMKHLGVLERCGLVRSHKQGRVRLCQLEAAPMRQAQDWLEQQRQSWEARTDRLARLVESLHQQELTAMTDRTLDPKLDLEIVRVLRAPRALVWKAWSDPTLLKQWWCPRPWTTEVRAFEFRTGGAFHTFMRGPDGGESDNPGVFLEVTPMSRIVWSSALGPGWRPQESWLPMTAFIGMEDEGAATRYSARVLHRDETSRRQHEEMGFHDGWNTCITQLEAFALTLA